MKALVTGGTRGIGAAIAHALGAGGFDVTITGTSPGGSPPAGMTYLDVDFSDRTAGERFAARAAAEGYAVLVNNAGINKIGPIEAYELSDVTRVLDVNFLGAYMLCKALVPGMRARKFGRIVNITSIWAVVGKEQRTAYAASKHALYGLTRALALEVAADNVLVNCVAPGVVDTELTRRVLGEAGINRLIAQVPMGRLARPDEVAEYVAFLCGEKNTFMTGQTLVVDGGFTCA